MPFGREYTVHSPNGSALSRDPREHQTQRCTVYGALSTTLRCGRHEGSAAKLDAAVRARVPLYGRIADVPCTGLGTVVHVARPGSSGLGVGAATWHSSRACRSRVRRSRTRELFSEIVGATVVWRRGLEQRW